jgi:hypothetical protein
MYRLYYSPGSCAMAARIALEEIGAPYLLELISSSGREKKRRRQARNIGRSIPKVGFPHCLASPAALAARMLLPGRFISSM